MVYVYSILLSLVVIVYLTYILILNNGKLKYIFKIINKGEIIVDSNQKRIISLAKKITYLTKVVQTLEQRLGIYDYEKYVTKKYEDKTPIIVGDKKTLSGAVCKCGRELIKIMDKVHCNYCDDNNAFSQDKIINDKVIENLSVEIGAEQEKKAPWIERETIEDKTDKGEETQILFTSPFED